jgi:lysophospholipase L1-like esterase
MLFFRMKKLVPWLLGFLLLLIVAEVILRVAGHAILRQAYSTITTPYQPGDSNIVFLGESSTIGLWVDRKDSYPRQLERMLRSEYENPRIRAIIPPHIGHNTSQVANRIQDYLDTYRPKLVVIMAGVNNEWALAESHIGRFLPLDSRRSIKIKSFIWLEQFRLFKVWRYAVIRMQKTEHPLHKNPAYVWGHTEFYRYPPEQEIYDFAHAHRSAFADLWRYDLNIIVSAAKAAGVNVLFMTYHITPGYLTPRDYENFSKEHGIPLVRNDLPFLRLRENQTIAKYLLHDNWHPNAAGYEIIARQAFRSIVEKNLLQ